MLRVEPSLLPPPSSISSTKSPPSSISTALSISERHSQHPRVTTWTRHREAHVTPVLGTVHAAQDLLELTLLPPPPSLLHLEYEVPSLLHLEYEAPSLLHLEYYSKYYS